MQDATAPASTLTRADLQHGHQRKRWPASPTFGVVRGNEFDQRGPRHHLFHLLQELALAGFLHTEIEVQSSLFQQG